MFQRIRINRTEAGLVSRYRDFERILDPGLHWLFGWRVRVEKVSTRPAFLVHPDLEVIARSGELDGRAEVLDLADDERALVWVDGRFAGICGPGVHALWTRDRKVRVDRVDARGARLEHEQLPAILENAMAANHLSTVQVEPGCVGLAFRDGRHLATLEPGVHAFWRGVGRIRVDVVDLREQVLDVVGQEILTSDKVTLRLNAVVVYRVTDALRAVTGVDDWSQALYREAQLVLRDAIGARELDSLLSERDGLADELRESLRARAAEFGVDVTALSLRDIVLPGEMRTLMNRVTEARKAAEANLIARREETAAMRSQANTARIFASNPTLLKLRELEVLETVAEKAELTVVLGEAGLSDRLTKLI